MAAGTTAIVDVDAQQNLVGLAAQTTADLVEAAEALKLTIVRPDVIRQKLGAADYDSLKRCGGKGGCVAAALAKLGVDRAVVGILGRDDKAYVVQLWLFDVKTGTLIADLDRTVLIASRRLQRDLKEAVPRLLRGEQEAQGQLQISANKNHARVFVNDGLVGEAPITLPMKPGKHEVRVEKRAYRSVTRLIDVEANRTATLAVELILNPGETPDDEKAPALTVKDTAAPGVALSPLTWVSGSVTVLAAGVALGVALAAKGSERTLLDGYNPTTDTYQGTRQDALSAQTFAAAANGLFIGAGVAAALTVVSIILDVRDAPDVSVAPAVSAGASGLLVRGSF